MNFLSKYEAHAYAALRIVAGFLMVCHGIQKLFGGLGGEQMIHDPLMLVAGIIEFCGGILVVIGLITRIAAFLISGMLAVAYFKVHYPFWHGSPSFFPIQNHGELAVALCFVFLFIATRGSGKWGVQK